MPVLMRIIVLQFPPKFEENKETIENFKIFFETVPRRNKDITIEFRGGWQKETITGLCRNFYLIHCVDPLAGKFRYYRLHGAPPGEQMYRYQYQQKISNF